MKLYKGDRVSYFETTPNGFKRTIIDHNGVKTFTTSVKPTKTKSIADVTATIISHKENVLKRSGWTDAPTVRKSTVLKPMLLHDYTKHSKKIEFPAIAQEKFDGVRCLWCPDTKMFLSRGLKTINLPHLSKLITEKLVTSEYLDGELFAYGKSLQEITSLVSAQSEQLIYVVFDVPSQLPYVSRYKQSSLISLLNCPEIIIPETVVVDSHEDVESFLKKVIDRGGEGIVVKNTYGVYKFDTRSYDVQKYKPVDSSEFVIVDCSYDLDTDGTKLIKFQCKTNNGITFTSVPKFKRSIRAEMWLNRGEFIGRMLTVEFRGLTDDGVPKHNVGVCIREE